MMRSLYSGVSGLRNHQTRMDVIGNNIANVNTAGFKASRTIFQDIYSQTVANASAPDAAQRFGGTNPMQIGLGVTLASIDVMHTPSATQRTDNPSDLAINGDGFFVVQNAQGFKYFTRAGAFKIDTDGNLVTSGGDFVLGVTSKSYIVSREVPDPATPGTPLQDRGIPLVLNATTTLYEVIEAFPAPATKAEADAITAVPPYYTWDDAKGYAVFNSDYYQIIEGPDPVTSYKLPTDFYADPPTTPPTINPVYLTADGVITGVAEFEPQALTKINLKEYIGISIDPAGVVRGVDPMTNQRHVLFTLAVAGFTNYGGLEKVGNSMYVDSPNSGSPVYSQAKTNGMGEMNPGGLEMSNVDLASEFTDMIVTQRGFQANSRIITVSDTLLEELVNLKR